MHMTGITIYRNGPKRTFLATETDFRGYTPCNTLLEVYGVSGRFRNGLSEYRNGLSWYRNGPERTETDICEYRNGLCWYRIVIWGVKIGLQKNNK